MRHILIDEDHWNPFFDVQWAVSAIWQINRPPFWKPSLQTLNLPKQILFRLVSQSPMIQRCVTDRKQPDLMVNINDVRNSWKIKWEIGKKKEKKRKKKEKKVSDWSPPRKSMEYSTSFLIFAHHCDFAQQLTKLSSERTIDNSKISPLTDVEIEWASKSQSLLIFCLLIVVGSVKQLWWMTPSTMSNPNKLTSAAKKEHSSENKQWLKTVLC